MVAFRFGQEADLTEILNLLSDENLPTDDVSLSKITFIIALYQDKIAGCIGLEPLGKDGLLRSLAVNRAMRNQGIGQQLYHRFLSLCAQLEITAIHLLTVDAESFFESKGFVYAGRDQAPTSVKQTAEFSQLCPTDCSYMVKTDYLDDARVYENNLQYWQTEKDTGSSYWKISGEQMSFTYFEVPAHKTFPSHQHDNEQITHVLEGKLFFQIADMVACIKPGDSIVIPAGVGHKVWTEDEAVKAVDSWAPTIAL